jgi:sigma-B regulation protein RsbU (phosphoserine phosphatase)
MCILVVDDFEDERDVTEAMLLAGGYEDVGTAASAAEAYRFLAVGEPTTQGRSSADLVLLDILMPEINGIEACAHIRNDPRYSDVPIIMVTSVDQTDSLVNAFLAGATDYIIKPVNHLELLARVGSALRLKTELDRRLGRERELTQFMSTWGNRRAAHWIDDATGLFLGEVAEAYLTAAAKFSSNNDTSVIALAIDRLDFYRSTQGDAAAAGLRALVARAVQTTAATVGAVAAAYRNGVIVLVVPGLQSKPAIELGEALRASVSQLVIANPEAIAADHITASVTVVTGRVNRWIDRVHLLTTAVAGVRRLAAAGGNRVVPHYA